MKTPLKLTVSAVVAALSVSLMLLSSLVPVATYVSPMIAGAMGCFLVLEIGFSWAVAEYVSVALLSFFLVTDKEAMLLYLLFFGFYPILKALIERINKRIFTLFLKLVVFNLSMIAVYYLSLFVFSIPEDSYTLFGMNLAWAFLIAGNVVFLLYDVCLSRLILLYIQKWQSRFRNNTKL